MEIKSKIKGFEGTVYLPEFLTVSQVNVFVRANEEVISKQDEIRAWDRDEIMMPAIFLCVERMEIANQPERPTPETFKFTPSEQADELIVLIIQGVQRLVMGEQEIPND